MKRRHPLDSLEEDIREHIERETDENIALGMAPADARNAALRKFGSVTLAREAVRDVWIPRWLQGLGQDIRLAFRSLRATPIVTCAAILSLALGVGANTAIFSLVDSLVLRSLPVNEPSRLAVMADGNWTNPIWEQVKQLPQFDSAFAWGSRRFNIAAAGESDLVNGIWASGGMFDALGVPAMIGRTLKTADDRRGAPESQVAVISYAFWQRHFAGMPDIVGRSLVIERTPFTVVGVTPRDFLGPDVGRSYDVAVPIGAEPIVHGEAESWFDKRSTWWLEIMVRLKPGQTIDQATAALRGAQSQIVATAYGPPPLNNNLKEPFTLVPAANGMSNLRTRYAKPLTILLGIVMLVLLIACANVANLLLARASARWKDWSLRLALGASRYRLVRQMLAESFVLAALGAAGGVVFAAWGARYLVHQISSTTSAVTLEVAADWRVLAFTLSVAVVVTMVSGAAPAFRAAGAAAMNALRDASRGTSSGRHRLLNAILMTQIAFSIVLLIAAGLFVRTFQALATMPLGFDDHGVVMVTVNAPLAAVPTEQRLGTFERVREQVLSVPGVASTGVSQDTLVNGGATGFGFTAIGGRPLPSRQSALVQEITPGWLTALRTPLLAGRDIVLTDDAAGAPVALVNETFARKFFGSSSPVGQTLQMTQGKPKEIVGVVGDAVYRSLREAVPPTIYLPFLQIGMPPDTRAPQQAVLFVRASHEADAALTRGIAAAVARVNPELEMTFRTLSDQVRADRNQERVVATLSAFFGGLALILAALGLYGVTSYVVTRRRGELGIRMALGAQPADIVSLVLTRLFVVVGIGVAAGLLASLWASRAVASLLFGLAPHDPLTLAGAALVLTAAATAAAAIPSYRASRIDPAAVLRES